MPPNPNDGISGSGAALCTRPESQTVKDALIPGSGDAGSETHANVRLS
jgi:hypothetical protein